MNNLPLFIFIGIAIVFALCFAHSKMKMTTPRSRFVVMCLLACGLAPFSYIGIWAKSGQSPNFELAWAPDLGMVMLAITALYSFFVALALKPPTRKKQKKDTAPSQ